MSVHFCFFCSFGKRDLNMFVGLKRSSWCADRVWFSFHEVISTSCNSKTHSGLQSAFDSCHVLIVRVICTYRSHSFLETESVAHAHKLFHEGASPDIDLLPASAPEPWCPTPQALAKHQNSFRCFCFTGVPSGLTIRGVAQ